MLRWRCDVWFVAVKGSLGKFYHLEHGRVQNGCGMSSFLFFVEEDAETLKIIMEW